MSIRSIAPVVIAALLLTGTASAVPQKSEYGTQSATTTAVLTAGDAQAIALEDAALTQDQVTGLRIQYDTDELIPEWDIEFRSGDWSYEYTIHAETGQILERDKEYDPVKIPAATAEKPAATEPAPTEPATTKPVTTEPATTKPAATEPATTKPAATEPATTKPATTKPAATEPATTKPAATEPVTTEPATTKPAATEPANTKPAATEPVTTEPSTTEAVTLLTAAEAERLALEHAGLTVSQVRKLESELDTERGKLLWEVEFEADNWEYDYVIDAATGQILHWEKDRDD